MPNLRKISNPVEIARSIKTGARNIAVDIESRNPEQALTMSRALPHNAGLLEYTQ
jgi:hypothetical protein